MASKPTAFSASATVGGATYRPLGAGKIYFYRGNRYLRYDITSEKVDLFYPKPLDSDYWPGWPVSWTSVDAAAYSPDGGGGLYFFRGDQYLRYDLTTGQVGTGYPKDVDNTNWPGWPSSWTSIDAAAYSPENRGRLYFFRADRYLRYDLTSGQVDAGYPKDLDNTNWPGWPASWTSIDAAAYSTKGGGKLYFYREDQYLRYDLAVGQVDAGYPKSLSSPNWFGWPLHWTGDFRLYGPMIGHVSSTEANIWIWLSRAEPITLRKPDGTILSYSSIDPTGGVAPIPQDIQNITPEGTLQILRIENLSPGTRFQIGVEIAGVEVAGVSFKTALPASMTGRVKLAFGSCADTSRGGNNSQPILEWEANTPVFTAIAQEKPDFFIFAGDTWYYVRQNGAEYATGRNSGDDDTNPFDLSRKDWTSTERMLLRAFYARNCADSRNLLRSIPCYATWDDHDFGFNNCHNGYADNDGWVMGEDAAKVFKAMWANPPSADPSKKGLYTSFGYGPLEVFITDTRTYKNPNTGAIWGQTQTQWLVDGLQHSQAPVKIVVVSTQFLRQRWNEGHEIEAPGERSTLLDTLSNVKGKVLFLTGDLHNSEVVQPPAPYEALDTLEFTSSPIRVKAKTPLVAGDSSRLWAHNIESYGLVCVDVEEYDETEDIITGTITLQTRNAANEVIVISDGVDGDTCSSDPTGTAQIVWDLSTGRVSCGGETSLPCDDHTVFLPLITQ